MFPAHIAIHMYAETLFNEKRERPNCVLKSRIVSPPDYIHCVGLPSLNFRLIKCRSWWQWGGGCVRLVTAHLLRTTVAILKAGAGSRFRSMLIGWHRTHVINLSSHDALLPHRFISTCGIPVSLSLMWGKHKKIQRITTKLKTDNLLNIH